MKDRPLAHCPCGSGKELASCCGPAHAGVPAPTAEALMRSRYAAFVTGNAEYIMTTQAGEAALKFDRREFETLARQTKWLSLEILSTEAGGPIDMAGTVTFKVTGRQNGQLFAQAERSEFRKIDGRWFYWRGEMSAVPVDPLSLKVGRNDPCPCGSGKKFKKCCGA